MLPASILAVLLLSIAFQCHAVLVNVTTTSRPKDGSINQPITGKWLAQLKTCSNGKPHFLVTLYRITYPVDSQMAGIKQRLLNSSTGLIVGRIYNFSDFCGFSLHVQPNTDALTLQSQTANNNQLETQLHKSFIESLSADENILQIASDMPVVVDAAVARRVTQRDATWNLQRINQRFLPLNPNYSYDERAGSGVDVYVLDTGILTAHPEFGGRASIGAVFTGESEETGDINGHGTHVAGIIGASTYGVAKKVQLIAVRVLNGEGVGSMDTIIAGIDWTVKRVLSTKRPSVINLSAGGPKYDLINNAIKAAVKAGIHVTISAGNSAMDACEQSPANVQIEGATVVGNSAEDDTISPSSNYGKCLTLFAPGSGILSTYTNPPGYPPMNTYTAYNSGTSMAAPHVAGVKALHLASRSYTPVALERQLLKTVTKNRLKNLPGKTTRNALVFVREV